MSPTRDSSPINRRDFTRAAVATVATSWLAACDTDPSAVGIEPQFAKGGGGKGGGKPKPPVARNPLYVPPTVSPDGLVLNVAETPGVDLGGGRSSNVLTYNGSFPGPTIVADRLDSASIRMNNGLSQPSITHWHGMIVDHMNDGHPLQAVGPGGNYDYDYTIDQRAALNWYHPHPHELTGEQVCLGLAGGYIIRDSEEAALGLPAGPPYEVPLVIRDASFDRAGNLQYKPRSGGFLGNTPLVNGTLDPGLGVDATVYRFRVLCGSNSRIFKLALSNGDPFTLIGNDGGLLSAAVSVAEIDMSPGERVDILIDFSALKVPDKVMLRDLNSGWDLLEFEVTGTGSSGFSIPGSLSTITPLGTPARERDFSFDGMSKINGKVYDMNRIDFTVPFGETELWRFTTNGNAPHPVHVHGVPFQVQSRSGGRGGMYDWEYGWKDTVLLEDGETVEVLIRFDVHKGLYLMHCHKLEHEDMGMMSNFEVG